MKIQKVKDWTYIVSILAFVACLNSCQYLEKEPLISNDLDTLLSYERDSTFNANYISREEMKTIEKKANLKMDSLRKACREDVLGLNNKYHVIVGSFKIPQNANHYLENLHLLGYNPQILEVNNGFHLVSAASFNHLDSARKALAALQDNITDRAWIYLKRQ